ncbi:MAG: citrate lyase acyl carrier protein [Megasphaera sp.]|uniref:citrate lyase acyl carrier protein n=1 Tax=Megasphaera sueciensis TaxID=349094 RepID=UPI003D05F851|nr:citrate lyase acyl carrier protein [Megasphaera sp.]
MGQVLSKSASAGFNEKQDALVTVNSSAPGTGIIVHLTSNVKHQYGKHMEKVIQDTIIAKGFTDIIVDVVDKGAWDYTLKARVESALERGMK